MVGASRGSKILRSNIGSKMVWGASKGGKDRKSRQMKLHVRGACRGSKMLGGVSRGKRHGSHIFGGSRQGKESPEVGRFSMRQVIYSASGTLLSYFKCHPEL